jgi:hypothetical protein
VSVDEVKLIAKESPDKEPHWESAHSLVEAITLGERLIANGETITHEEAKRRLQKWLA